MVSVNPYFFGHYKQFRNEYIAQVIHTAIIYGLLYLSELEQEPAQIFISYQWDSQDEVKGLRDRLERSGYSCWMDIGQLGGGDHLYTKIDEALRQCKVWMILYFECLEALLHVYTASQLKCILILSQ